MEVCLWKGPSESIEKPRLSLRPPIGENDTVAPLLLCWTIFSTTMNRFSLFLVGFLFVFWGLSTPLDAQPLSYPETRRVDQVDFYHNLTIGDPYRWLEEMTSAETETWVRAQDALTQAYVAGNSVQEALEERILLLQQSDRYSIPSRNGTRYFTGIRASGAPNSVVYMQEGLSGERREILNPESHPHFQFENARLGMYAPSRNGEYLAYQVGKGQTRWRTTYILDVNRRQSFEESLQGVRGSVAWDGTAKGFYYVRYGVPEKGEELQAQLVDAQIFYHELGTSQDADRLIYERPEDPTWSFGVQVSHDGHYLIVSATPGGSFTGMVEHLLVKDLRDPSSLFLDLFKDPTATYAYEGNLGSRFLIRTDLNAPKGQLLTVDVKNPSQREVVIPETEEVLNTISVTKNFLIARYTHDARPLVKVFEKTGQFRYDLSLPNLGSVNGLGDVHEADEAFYAMNILYDPGVIYRLDVASGKSTVFEQPDLPYDPDDFVSKQVMVTSKDGTQVPMYIIHKKGLELDGNHPVFMYAYGAYAWVAWPWYQPPLVAWLEMGGVYALPNVRGGGEYGEDWHQAGIRINKQNAIDDYIAATEWLINQGYTNPQRMIANGGSASGALAAAAYMQRPDLYAASIIDIANLDLLRSHLFPGGANRVPEYGSAENPDEFQALYRYSPYHNIRSHTCYPPTLVTVGSRDEVAVPLHSYKFVAAMQHNQSCSHPVLLNVAWDAGHSYGLNAEQQARTWSYVFSFLIRTLELDYGLSSQTAETH